MSIRQFTGAALLLVGMCVNGYGQQCGCEPSCAVPCEPSCGVPPDCAVPQSCHTCNTCVQQSCCDRSCDNDRSDHWCRGLLRCCRLPPLINCTKINIRTKECCDSGSSSPASVQGSVQSVPLTFQPVQLQMTAYQPMVQQVVQPVVQQVVRPMAYQPVSYQQVAAQPRAAVAAAPAAGNSCNLPQVCRDLEELKARVRELQDQLNSGSGNSKLEERIANNEAAVQKLTVATEKLEEASNLQTEILQQMKKSLFDDREQE